MNVEPDTDPGSPHVGDVTDADRLDAAARWLRHGLAGRCTPASAAARAIRILQRIEER